jgi:hypothetical protein
MSTLPLLRPSDTLFCRRRRSSDGAVYLPVFSFSFGQCVLLPAHQELNQFFPRMEAKRLSGIHLFNTAFELFSALFALIAKAYYKSSLHDQIQLTAPAKIQREKSVEFP